jgi:Flp pilus assembly protein TadG
MTHAIFAGLNSRPASSRRWIRGTAALEFGLAMPFLLVLVIGLVEVGLVTYEAMQVQDAAEAGALYASRYPADLTGMANAAVNATGTAGIAASPTPLAFCGCPSASGITAISCATLCTGGIAAGHYVKVSTALTHVRILTFTGLPNPLVLTGKSTVRVQ